LPLLFPPTEEHSTAPKEALNHSDSSYHTNQKEKHE
jgi:hypothetical protein